VITTSSLQPLTQASAKMMAWWQGILDWLRR
jgi:hypothetical protein